MEKPASPQRRNVLLACDEAEARRLVDSLIAEGTGVKGEWPLIWVTVKGRRLTVHWASTSNRGGPGRLLITVTDGDYPKGLKAMLEGILGKLPPEARAVEPDEGASEIGGRISLISLLPSNL